MLGCLFVPFSHTLFHSFIWMCSVPSKLIIIQVKGIAKIKDTWMTPSDNSEWVRERARIRSRELAPHNGEPLKLPFLTLQFYHSCARFNILSFAVLIFFLIRCVCVCVCSLLVLFASYFIHAFSLFRVCITCKQSWRKKEMKMIASPPTSTPNQTAKWRDCDQLHDSHFPNIHHDFCSLSSLTHRLLVYIYLVSTLIFWPSPSHSFVHAISIFWCFLLGAFSV